MEEYEHNVQIRLGYIGTLWMLASLICKRQLFDAFTMYFTPKQKFQMQNEPQENTAASKPLYTNHKLSLPTNIANKLHVKQYKAVENATQTRANTFSKQSNKIPQMIMIEYVIY